MRLSPDHSVDAVTDDFKRLDGEGARFNDVLKIGKEGLNLYDLLLLSHRSQLGRSIQ